MLPSILRSEAFGIVLLEAMACKKPVVSTELGTGTSYVNENGRTGIVVQPRNSKALNEAINFLLKNEHKRFEYREKGFERVKRFFTMEKMMDKVVAVYKERRRSQVQSLPFRVTFL